MNKKLVILLSVVFIGVLVIGAIRYGSIKDDKLYSVVETTPPKDIAKINSEVKSEGRNPFYDIDNYLKEIDKNSILVTLSPDKRYIFYMSPSHGPSPLLVVKGRTSINMDLYIKDIVTGDITLAASRIPFITSAAWNSSENICAFKGESFLLLYDIEKRIPIIQPQLDKQQIRNAAWSPDGKKVYLEYPSIPNGGVVYIESQKLAQSYEIKEEVFFKDILSTGYYFCTKQNLNTVSSLLSSCNTVITDAQGDVVTDLGSGIYKDSFKKSVLLLNLDNSLSLIKDFNNSGNTKAVTKKPVFDAGFVYDGGFYYITQDEESLNNEFVLHRINSEGVEIMSQRISGSSLFLQSDGKKGYVDGEKLELVDFESNTCIDTKSPSHESDPLLNALSGGLNIAKTSLVNGNLVTDSSLFSESAAASANKMLQNAYNSVPKSFRDLYISFNPEEKVIITGIKVVGEKKIEVSVRVNVTCHFIKDFKAEYKILLDAAKWQINDINSK